MKTPCSVVNVSGNSPNPASCMTNICRLALIIEVLKKMSCCNFRTITNEKDSSAWNNTVPCTFDVTVQ